MTDTAPLLAMEGIEKSFPGVKALKGVQLDLHSGEVHAVVGENGAGKSTLIKVLAGVHIPDAGQTSIAGESMRFTTPLDAQEAGIAVIYQEFNLVPALSVRENILLGHETARWGFFSKKEESEIVSSLFERMNVRIDPDATCATLSVAQQQLVEIAKALSTGARIIVMDEPSATLTNQEVEKLFAIIRDLQSQGIGIIYISHRLDEIFTIADRVTVIRDGEYIDTKPVAEVNRDMLIEMMVGRSIDNEFPKEKAEHGEVRLEIKGLAHTTDDEGVSFQVHSGEILGLTGLVGAGRTELARLIFGADKAAKGDVLLDGKKLKINSPLDAIQHGICLLTEDRKAQGLVLGLSSRENFALPNMDHWSSWGFVAGKTERSRFAEYIDSLKIKISHQDQLAKNLSGGNQQKVLLARWLESNSDVIIFDEPTRGIDVGAKYEIYLLMNKLAASGKAIIMISSELPEVLGMSDRILVMHDGHVSGEITDVENATQEAIMELAVA